MGKMCGLRQVCQWVRISLARHQRVPVTAGALRAFPKQLQLARGVQKL
jgi:hypothetical protein